MSPQWFRYQTNLYRKKKCKTQNEDDIIHLGIQVTKNKSYFAKKNNPKNTGSRFFKDSFLNIAKDFKVNINRIGKK